MDHDDRTVFVLDPAQFDRLASHAAVYLDGGYWTGPARAIVAAQAAGVPVVAVDTPIRRRLIDVDRTGYVAPHHDLEQLTRHAHRLLNDESLRATMSAAALNFASTQFPLRPMLDAYAGVYRRAAS
jgi:glycosyltransferase involved in cell wall biosynthesis